MFLIPAKEVVAGDLILTKGSPVERKIVLRTTTLITENRPHVGLYTSEADAWYYRAEEEVLVIRRGTRPAQNEEERIEALIRLTKSFLLCLEIDRDGDGSTDFLIAMAGAGHELKEKLEEAYCSGDHPCFPSGNREPSE